MQDQQATKIFLTLLDHLKSDHHIHTPAVGVKIDMSKDQFANLKRAGSTTTVDKEKLYLLISKYPDELFSKATELGIDIEEVKEAYPFVSQEEIDELKAFANSLQKSSQELTDMLKGQVDQLSGQNADLLEVNKEQQATIQKLINMLDK